MGQRPRLLNFSDLSEGREFIFNNPLGFRKDGRPIFAIAGGSGDGDGKDEDEDDDDDSDGDQRVISLSRYLKLQKRMRAADRRASTAEARVTELEQQVEKVPGLEKKLADANAVVQKLRLDNAFLTANSVDWHDPEAALRLADLSNVKFSEDGKVSGLEEALKELAEKKPYLVKAKADEGKADSKSGAGDSDDDEDDDEEDDEDDDDTSGAATVNGAPLGGQNGGTGGGVSGTSTGSGKRRRGGKGPSDEELMRRYRI